MATKQIVHLFDLNKSIGYLNGNAFCGTTTGSLGEPDLGIARQRVSMENGGLNPPGTFVMGTSGFEGITSPDGTKTYSYANQNIEYPREAIKPSPSDKMILRKVAFLLAEYDDSNPVPRFEPSDRLAYAKELPLRVGVIHKSPLQTAGTGAVVVGLTFIMLPFLNPTTGIILKNYNWDSGVSGVAQIGFCIAVGRDVRNHYFYYAPMGWLENNKMVNCRNSELTDSIYNMNRYNNENYCVYVLTQSFPTNHEHYIYVDILKSRQHAVRFVSKTNPELYDYRYIFTGENDKISENFFPSVPYKFGLGFVTDKHNHETYIHENTFQEFIYQDIHRL